MTDDEIKEACIFARGYADGTYTVGPTGLGMVARALLAVVTQRDEARLAYDTTWESLGDEVARADTAEQRGYQRALDEVAAHFSTQADMLNHRRVVHGNTMVCDRREATFYEAAGIIRSWAGRTGRAKPTGGDRG